MKAFHFKQFSIEQNNCAMKVSLDACVFGALCQADNSQRILDIGTGTGLLSLMLAQRCDAHIDAIELDENAAKQAEQNIDHSPFASQIFVHVTDIKKYKTTQKYVLIICNPPFFSDHLKGPDAKRNQARHNDGLSFETLNECIAHHLVEDGKAWMLLPCSEFERFMESARHSDLQLDKKWLLSSRPQKAPHRIIFSLTHNASPATTEPAQSLWVHCEQGPEYTEAFKSLLCDYYLKLGTGRLFSIPFMKAHCVHLPLL